MAHLNRSISLGGGDTECNSPITELSRRTLSVALVSGVGGGTDSPLFTGPPKVWLGCCGTPKLSATRKSFSSISPLLSTYSS